MLSVAAISVCSNFEKLEIAVSRLNSNGVFSLNEVSYCVRSQELYRLLDDCLKNGSVVVESRFPLRYRLTNVRPINMKQRVLSESRPLAKEEKQRGRPKDTQHDQAILDAVEEFKSKGKPFTNKDICAICGIKELQLTRSRVYRSVQEVKQQILKADQENRLRNAINTLKQKGCYIYLSDVAETAKTGCDRIKDFPQLAKELNQFNSQFNPVEQRKNAIKTALQTIKDSREICSLNRVAELAKINRKVLDNPAYRDFKEEFWNIQQEIKTEKAVKIRTVYQFK